LPKGFAVTNHKLHKEEHSVEALIPFLKAFNPGVEIVPVLVPFMSFGRMDTISAQLADVLADYLLAKGLVWGKDVAIVVSNDAVHYGDQDWGGKDYSLYGTDTVAFARALEQEDKIISQCLLPGPDKQRAMDLMNYLVFEENPKVYKWTWCGRYSVPFALCLVSQLAILTAQPFGPAEVSMYSTSISQPALRVSDLGMGVTAPANLRHWVGYVAMFWK
jgi:AmmeMemoRadiSam system protein B